MRVHNQRQQEGGAVDDNRVGKGKRERERENETVSA